jgi:leucyl-tRNA synthetase
VCVRDTAIPLVLMLAPLAPHICEEIAQRMGHDGTIAYQGFPVADPAELVDDTVTLVVQINGKVRDRVEVSADADAATVEAAAMALPRIA